MAEDIKEPPKKGLIRGLLGRKQVPKSQEKEREREGNAWKKKLFGYLEGFKKSFEALEGKKEGKGKGILSKIAGWFSGGLKGLMGKIMAGLGLTGIFAGLGGLGAMILPAAIIIWGITSVFRILQKWTEGFKEGGFTGAIATALGNKKEGGWASALGGAATWAGAGAMVGLGIGGPIGALVGGLIGAAFGGFFGWLGSDRIKAALDNVTKMFDLDDPMTDAEKEVHKQQIEANKARISEIGKKGGLMDQVEAEIQVYEDLKAEGKTLTENQLQALATHNETLAKLAAEQLALLKANEELEKDLAQQEFKKAQEKRKDLEKKLAVLTGYTMGTKEGEEMGEIGLLTQQIRIKRHELSKLDEEEDKEKIKALSAEIAALEKSRDSKRKLADIYLIQRENARENEYQELKKIYEDGDASMMQRTKYWFRTSTRWIGNAWESSMNFLRELPTTIGNWIYTPGGTETGPPGTGTISKAKLFGITLEWPSWMKSSASFIVDKWNSLTEWFGNTIETIGKWIWNSEDSSADSPGKLFGITIPTWSALGTSITTAWNNLTTWADEIVQRVADWIWKGGTEEGQAGVLFDTFTIPTWAALGTAVSDSWDNLKSWAGGLVTTIGLWIWDEKENKLFNTFTIPTWSQAGDAVSDSWDNLKSWAGGLVSSIGAWIYTGQKVTPGPQGTVVGAKIFGVQLPPLPSLGDAISEAWNKLTTWVKNIGLWFWNKEEGTMFGKFTIPTLSLPDIQWDAIVQAVMGKIVSILGKIPFIDRVPGMEAFLDKWDPQASAQRRKDEAQKQIESLQKDLVDIESKKAKTQEKGGTITDQQQTAIDAFRDSGYMKMVSGLSREQNAIAEKINMLAVKGKDIPEELLAQLNTGKITADELARQSELDAQAAEKREQIKAALSTIAASNQILNQVKIGTQSSLGVTLVDPSSKPLLSSWGGAIPVDQVKRFDVPSRPSDQERIARHQLLESMKSEPANIGALLALLAQSSGGRGSTTINNITVAPSSSNTVSSVSKSENTYGTVDPYTAASGAYG